MNKELIIKFVGSIICIIVMSVVIFFVYNYYSDKALKGNNTNTNTSTNTNTNTDDNNETDNNQSEITVLNLKEFKNVKTYVEDIDGKVIINYENTDAGNVLLINDHTITYYSAKDKVYYGVLKDAIVINVVSDTEGNTIVFADTEGTPFKIYSYENNGKYNLYIKEPVMSKDIKEAVTFDKTTLTISYSVLKDENNNIILTNDEVLDISNNSYKEEGFNTYNIVEYTMEIEYLGNKKFTEPVKLEEYTLKEYIDYFK